MGRAKGGQAAVNVAAFGAAMRPRGAQAPAAPVPVPGERQTVVDRLGFGALLASRGGQAASSQKVVRSLSKRDFVADLDAWKEQENQFVEGARAELDAGMREFARSGQWGAFIRLYAQSPEYSPTNSLWARGQLARKWTDLVEAGLVSPQELGDPGEGRFFSASAAKALGDRDKGFSVRVKNEYFYRPGSGFDDRYTVEMSKPLGFNGFWAEKPAFTSSGRPIMDPKTGQQKIRKEFVKTVAKGFGTFQAYHQSALERVVRTPVLDADGKHATDPDTNKKTYTETVSPFEMPAMPWQDATGSDADAAKLIADLERICSEEDLKVLPFTASTPTFDRLDPTAALPVHARYDQDARAISLDSASSAPERAVALLGAMCEHLGYDRPPRDDLERKVRAASVESAKYAIASLYGLAADNQVFPHLVELADDDKAVGRVASDTHRRVQQVLAHLDPVMRAKARAEGERKSKARKSAGRGRKSAAGHRVAKQRTAS